MAGTTYKFIFNIGIDDIANGKLPSWDTLKTLKLQARNMDGDEVTMFRTFPVEGSHSVNIDSNNIFVTIIRNSSNRNSRL